METVASPPRFRLVLSPTKTPASALLVPRRLQGLQSQLSQQQSNRPAQEHGGENPPTPTQQQGGEHPSSQAQQPRAMEVSAKAMAAAEALAIRVGSHGGAALIIDYGEGLLQWVIRSDTGVIRFPKCHHTGLLLSIHTHDIRQLNMTTPLPSQAKTAPMRTPWWPLGDTSRSM